MDRGGGMRYQGRVVEWRDDRGFGFVVRNGGDERVFLHIKAFRTRPQRPVVEQLVSYAQIRDARGRARAVDAAFVHVQRPAQVHHPSGGWRVLLTGVFLLTVTGLVLARKLPAPVLWVYLGASVITLVTYAHDKAAAQAGRWRTQESTLHTLALAGGWPGALLAQHWLRHKNRKASFQHMFWLTALINGAAFAWLLMPSGAQFLDRLLTH